MIRSHLLSIIIVIGVTCLVTYKASFLKNKRVFRLSLFEILYMILLPGIISVLINSYVNGISALPLSTYAVLSDGVLKNIIMLAILFTYGGQVVHIVSKSLFLAGLKHDDSEAAQLNEFLHLPFSHNLIYSGLFLLVVSLTLLELGHVPAYEYDKLWIPITRGLVLGAVFVGAMYRYIRPDEEEDYPGRRWADFKATFILGWVGTIIIAYIVTKFDTNLKEYQLVLPSLLGFAVINIVNVALFFRHVKNRKKT